MQTVVMTPLFLADAKAAGVVSDEIDGIATLIASDPQAGDLIVGTGGARKVRVGGKGKGKSGGYRVITFYAAPDVPVFLLRLVAKGQRADISQGDRNTLRIVLSTLAETYRDGVRRRGGGL
jgi:hypothetical protein